VTDDALSDGTRDKNSKESEGSSILGSIIGGLVTAAAVGAVNGIGKSGKSNTEQSSGDNRTESPGNAAAPANQNTPGAMKSPPAAATNHKPAEVSKDSNHSPAQPKKDE
jgi:hypothetical protein